MAHHHSAKKRIRSDKKKNFINKTRLSALRTLIKKLKSSFLAYQEQSIKKEEVIKLFHQVQSKLAKSAAKKLLHKNKARRMTSRLAHYLDSLIKKTSPLVENSPDSQ